MSELFNRLKKIEQEKQEQREDESTVTLTPDLPPALNKDEEGFPIEGEIKRQAEESRWRFKIGAKVGAAIFIIALLTFGVIKGRLHLGQKTKSAVNSLKPKDKIPKQGATAKQPQPEPARTDENVITSETTAGDKKGTDIAVYSNRAVMPPEGGTQPGETRETEPEVAAQKAESQEQQTVAEPVVKASPPAPAETPIFSQGDAGQEMNYFENAVTQYKENRMPDAMESIKKGLRQNPQTAVGYNNLGVIYFQQGELNESLSQFNMAIQLNPQYAEAHYNIALTLEQMGRNQTALYHYLKFVELAPPQLKQLQEHVKAHIDIY